MKCQIAKKFLLESFIKSHNFFLKTFSRNEIYLSDESKSTCFVFFLGKSGIVESKE